MVKGLYSAYTGMLNEQKRMDIITNNLANTDTTGYKKEGVTNQSFHDVLAYRLHDASTPGTDPHRMGAMSMGVKLGETYTDYDQGALKQTDNQFDLALAGKGFFAIQFTDKGGNTTTKYTRDGNFTLTKEGYLVTQDGSFVLGTGNNRITLSTTADTKIDEQGRIYQNDKLVDTIQIADFADYNYLEKYGENLYNAIEGATRQTGDATVQQGYLETSNVQTVSEMVSMIAITRNYETNQKVIQTMDKSLQIAANQIGKV